MPNDRLIYDSIWDAVFEDNPEKARDFEMLSKLALKYRDEVQLHFGTEQEFKDLLKMKDNPYGKVTVSRR